MTSQEIEKSLVEQRALHARNAALLAEAQKSRATTETRFNKGAAELDELTTAAARVSGLEGANHRVELQISTLEGDLKAAIATETRAAGIAELKEAAEQANVSFETYTQTLQSSFAAIEAAARAAITASQSHQAERQRFQAALRKLVPSLHMAHAAQFGKPDGQAVADALQQVRSELVAAGVDLSGISASLDGHQIEVFNRDAYQLPTSYFQSELDEAAHKVRQLDSNAKAQQAQRLVPPLTDAEVKAIHAKNFPEPGGSGAWQSGVSQTVQIVQ